MAVQPKTLKAAVPVNTLVTIESYIVTVMTVDSGNKATLTPITHQSLEDAHAFMKTLPLGTTSVKKISNA